MNRRRAFAMIVLGILLFSVFAFGQHVVVPQLPEQRVIVAVLDLTPSFPYTAESVDKIKGVVRALGPGDSFFLVTLGGDFSPAKDVAIQCIMPKVDSGILVPAENIRVWRERQANVEAAWNSAERKQAAVLKALDQPFKQEKVTPLYQALSYLSHWFAAAPADGTHLLLIFSDLEHDYAGLRSPLPPSQRLPFTGATVTAAFVPWQASWSNQERVWREWMSPASFTMLDEARARVAVLVTPNKTPHSAPRTF